MQGRTTLPRLLSAAALALLFGATGAHAEGAKSTQAQTGTSEPSAAVASGDVNATTSSASEAAGTSAGTESSGASGASGTAASGSAPSAASDAVAEVARVSRGDRNIMRDIAQVNHAEIQISKLALERSQDPEIRAFAQRMIDDHTKLHADLQQLAQVKDVQLPDQADRAHQRLADRLSKMEGEDFDRAYRAEVAEKAHEKTHKKLQRAQKKADDPAISALVTQALPIIEQHVGLAENLGPQRQASGDSGAPEDQTEAASGAAGAADTTSGTTPESSGTASNGSAPSSGATDSSSSK